MPQRSYRSILSTELADVSQNGTRQSLPLGRRKLVSVPALEYNPPFVSALSLIVGAFLFRSHKTHRIASNNQNLKSCG